jgi:hypothetical protein
MNEVLIKQLKEGKIAVHNDGTLKELTEVLRYAFPKDGWSITGANKYYISHGNTHWILTNETDLPSYSVKEFLKEEEFILPEKWCIYANKDNIDVIANFYNTANRKYKLDTYDKSHVNRYFSSHNLSGGQSIFSDNPASNYTYKLKRQYSGYTEITFEQFKEHILKEEIMEKKIKYYVAQQEVWGINNTHWNKGSILYSSNTESLPYFKKLGILNNKEWFEPVYEEDKIEIGGYEVKFLNKNSCSINGVEYIKTHLETLRYLMNKGQIKSLNVGCSGQYTVDLPLLDKIIDKF